MTGRERPANPRFTDAAKRDVASVLVETSQRFGSRQLRVYAGLLDRAAALVAREPRRLGSRGRPELGEGVRSFHVELATRRRGAASHILYYLASDGGAEGAVILRVLHEAMDPSRHVPPDDDVA